MKPLYYIVLVIFGLTLAWGVVALSADDIVFPVAELGNCQDEQECKQYCSDSSHMEECITFAEKYDLMTEQEIERARQFESIGGVGPGGCTNEFECQFYCEDINHIEECVAFAEENGLMDPDELEEARMVIRALQQGVPLPGGCTNEQECEAYCEDPNNMRECIAFAEAAGFMSPGELREAKQMLKALDAGITPPDCRGKAECDVYCQEPSHVEECIEFSIAAGFIPPEEAEEVRKMLPLMKSGRMPEWCRDKEQCEAYCADESHIDECTDFFVGAGFMSPEDAEMFRKTGGKGPGDCQGKEECESYCNDPAHQEVCFEFAREHGLISEDELRNMEEGVRQFQDWFATAPPEVAQCLQEQVGDEVLQEIQAGTFMPGPELINNLEQCFALQQQIVENQMRECISKSCDEFFSCMGAISQQGGGPGGGGPDEGEHGQEGEGGGFGGGALEQEIQAKMDVCMQEQFQQQQQNFFPSGFEHQGDGQFPGGGPEGEFVPQEFQHLIPQGAENLAPGETENIIREQQEQEFERQFQEQQHQQIEQFQQLIPELPQLQGGSGPLLEEIQRIEQEEALEVEQQQQEEQAQQQQLEQELQQQFQELEQLQQQLQEQQAPPSIEDAAQGNILEAAGRFLQ